jgi:hypothetical protein
MKKVPLAVLILSVLSVTTVFAQQPVARPTIITFTTDLSEISVDDAETGQTSATLSWHVVGLTDAYHLFLQTYVLDTWQLLPTQEPLPATGSYPLTVQHPLNFGPPTYRLIVADQDFTVLAERVITIPYAVQTNLPTINSFTSSVQQLEANALAQGTAAINVSWDVANRAPTANLMVEQVLENGQSLSVELPRPNLWIPSTGQGPIRPGLPLRDNLVRLRLRVVDMVDGTVFDEADLIIPVVGTVNIPPSPTPVPLSTVTPAPTATSSTSQAQIISLAVAPGTVDRSGTVTLSWEVRNASMVSVWRLNPSGQVADFLDNVPLTGTWTVRLPEYYVDNAMFQLWATDAYGVTTSSSVTVQVRCPYTYFFGQPPPGTACPLAAARDVNASFQTFERGFMVWNGDRRQIYVFFDGSSLGRYQDTWTEGETFDTGALPAGLVAPERGFGKVWTQELGVRDRLGWATSLEQPYTMRIQTSGAYRYPYTYLMLPDGRVVYMVESSWGFQGP